MTTVLKVAVGTGARCADTCWLKVLFGKVRCVKEDTHEDTSEVFWGNTDWIWTDQRLSSLSMVLPTRNDPVMPVSIFNNE